MTETIRNDILWWADFMERFNGTTFFLSTEPTSVPEFSTDASLVGGGGHYQQDCRIVCYVEQNKRERRTRYFKEVKENRSIMSIVTEETGQKLQVRKLSCYCDGYLDGSRECSNVEYVGVWEEVQLQHEVQPDRRSTRADSGSGHRGFHCCNCCCRS
ncbi:hypothetical protein ACROYT_G015415 [Oculina patagonica]